MRCSSICCLTRASMAGWEGSAGGSSWARRAGATVAAAQAREEGRWHGWMERIPWRKARNLARGRFERDFVLCFRCPWRKIVAYFTAHGHSGTHVADLSEVTDTQGRDLPPDYLLFDRGLLDSMTTVQLIAALSEEFSLDISPADFDREAWPRPNCSSPTFNGVSSREAAAPLQVCRRASGPPDARSRRRRGLFAVMHAFVRADIRRHIERFNANPPPGIWRGSASIRNGKN